MTRPIEAIIKTDLVDSHRDAMQQRQQQAYSDNQQKREKHGEDLHERDDMVKISDEARKRSSGTWHRSILEHLEDL